jgi:hypothetical protein
MLVRKAWLPAVTLGSHYLTVLLHAFITDVKMTLFACCCGFLLYCNMAVGSVLSALVTLILVFCRFSYTFSSLQHYLPTIVVGEMELRAEQ